MERWKLDSDWHQLVFADFENFETPLRRYRRYLEDQSFRESTVESYIGIVGIYNKFGRLQLRAYG